MQTKTWMDRAPQYLQNILTDHAQKRHGSLCSNMNTWIKNNNRAKTQQKTGHGNNRIMKACLRARCTQHKALHDKLSILPTRRHDHEAKQSQNKFISCMDQLQQPWQNSITCKQSARNILQKNQRKIESCYGTP